VPYTRNRDVCSENLRSGWVTKVEISQDGATTSDRPETIWWDVATGARKDKVAGQLACSSKAEIGRYIVTQEEDLLFVYETRMGANDDADGEGKVLTAFFGLGFRI
jgi:hypothetical protein